MTTAKQLLVGFALVAGVVGARYFYVDYKYKRACEIVSEDTKDFKGLHELDIPKCVLNLHKKLGILTPIPDF